LPGDPHVDSISKSPGLFSTLVDGSAVFARGPQQNWPIFGFIAATGLPFPELGTVLATLVEVEGSLALHVGFQPRWVVLVMAMFTAATAFFFHKFWAAAPDRAVLQNVMFFKNMAICGGLMMVSAPPTPDHSGR